MIKTVIFDFDGVLVESVHVKTDAFARLFESYGPEVVRQVIEYHLANGGMSRFDKLEYFYREILHEPLTAEKSAALAQRFSELVVEEVVKCPYVPGATEFLERHHHQYEFYVVSATPQEEIRDIVQRRGIREYFRDVFGSPAKKHEIIVNILNQGGYQPSEAVFVGDAINDYEAAAKAGCLFVGRVPDGSRNVFPDNTTMITDLTGLEHIIAGITR